MKTPIQAMSGPLQRMIDTFEAEDTDAVFIVPLSWHEKPESRLQLIRALVVMSESCGMIGRNIHNSRKHTRLYLSAETGEIFQPIGNAYRLGKEHYADSAWVDRLCMRASAGGRYRTYEFCEEGH